MESGIDKGRTHEVLNQPGSLDPYNMYDSDTTPLTAILNHLVITASNVPLEGQPGPFLRIWSWFGIAAMLGFAVAFLYARFVV